jgi:hypothetical protein
LGEGIGLKYDGEKNCLYVADMAGRLWKCNPGGGLKEKIYEGPTHVRQILMEDSEEVGVWASGVSREKP